MFNKAEVAGQIFLLLSSIAIGPNMYSRTLGFADYSLSSETRVNLDATRLF